MDNIRLTANACAVGTREAESRTFNPVCVGSSPTGGTPFRSRPMAGRGSLKPAIEVRFLGPELFRDRLTAGRQSLKLPIEVRVLVPGPAPA